MDRRMRRSEAETMPRSPCNASVGFRNSALVPVDTKVWQTFCAMKPLFPMPENSSVPGHAKQACTENKLWICGTLEIGVHLGY